MSSIYDIAGTTSDSFSLNGKITLLQGDTSPEDHQGLNGDYYFQSNGSLWAKKDGTWLNLTGTALPDASSGTNKLLYSNGENYAFANVEVTNDGELNTTIKKIVPADETGDIILASMADDDLFRVTVGGPANQGWVEIATGDEGTEQIYVRQYQGNNIKNEMILLDADGNTSIPHNLSIGGTATSSKPSSSSSTSSSILATIGWVNDPAYSTNVVHRTGNETAAGNKTWSGTSTFSGDISATTGTFSGVLNAATASNATNTTQVATTQWFNNKIQVVNNLPSNPDANTFYFIKEN